LYAAISYNPEHPPEVFQILFVIATSIYQRSISYSLKYIKQHGLLKDPEISYPFLPSVFEFQSIRNEKSLHRQVLDNIDQLKKDIDQCRQRHWFLHDDLLIMVRFILKYQDPKYQDPKWTPYLLNDIVNNFTYLVKDIKDHLEQSEKSNKVVNLKEWASCR